MKLRIQTFGFQIVDDVRNLKIIIKLNKSKDDFNECLKTSKQTKLWWDKNKLPSSLVGNEWHVFRNFCSKQGMNNILHVWANSSFFNPSLYHNTHASSFNALLFFLLDLMPSTLLFSIY
jgi:hypothetical protein